MRIYQTQFQTDRTQAMYTGGGLVSANYPPQAMRAGAIPTAGTTNGTTILGLLGLRAGDTVTNVVVYTTVAGTALSFAKLGLYTPVGSTSATLVAATGSVSATFNAGAGFKVVPLTAPYVVPTTGAYQAAFLQWGSGATGATLGLALGANLTAAIGSGAFFTGNIVTQADLASAAGTVAVESNNYWFGVS